MCPAPSQALGYSGDKTDTMPVLSPKFCSPIPLSASLDGGLGKASLHQHLCVPARAAPSSAARVSVSAQTSMRGGNSLVTGWWV